MGILGYEIFTNFYFGKWDIDPIFWDMGYSGIWGYGILEIFFGIQVKLILGYGIFWTVYFGIWDIAYPPNQASLIQQ